MAEFIPNRRAQRRLKRWLHRRFNFGPMKGDPIVIGRPSKGPRRKPATLSFDCIICERHLETSIGWIRLHLRKHGMNTFEDYETWVRANQPEKLVDWLRWKAIWKTWQMGEFDEASALAYLMAIEGRPSV